MRTKLTVVAVVLILIIPFNFNSFNRHPKSTEINPINDETICDFENRNIENSLTNAPMAFTENHGQLENDNVRFYTQSGGIWFTDDGVWFEVREELSNKHQDLKNSLDPMARYKSQEPVEYKKNVIKLEFVSANQVRPVGRERLDWDSNFFYGNDSSRWCTNVPNYDDIVYENIWDGIDLIYRFQNGAGLKYEFIVHPGSDHTKIKVRVEGHNDLLIDESGSLVLSTRWLGHDLRDTNLKVFYADNTEDTITASFSLLDKNIYTFFLQSRDITRTVIIDPLVYSTFIGGRSADGGNSIAVDDSKYAYITGVTDSLNFPITTGAYDTTFNRNEDVFVVKLNPTGTSLVYSTFIGGNTVDRGLGISVDGSGYVYLTGETASSNFPTTLGVYDTLYNGGAFDVFAVKLNSTGSSMVYSTFIGGNNRDWGWDISVDGSGDTYIIGYTESSNFPTTAGAYDTTHDGTEDGFALKLNLTGASLMYSTFIGGFKNDYCGGMSVDGSGYAYITGSTESSDFPTTAGAYDTTFNGNDDVFVLKLNLTGSALGYSTFIGGSSYENGGDITLDFSGGIYITGYTRSSDFPTTMGAYDTTYNGDFDVFTVKFNPLGSTLMYSTFIGGSGNDRALGIEVNGSSGDAYITGYTNSSNFPTTPGANNTTYNGGVRDGFALKLNTTGASLEYSTFIGGSSEDYSLGIAADSSGYVYIIGMTKSSNFPITPGAFDTTYNGGNSVRGDVFVLKLLTLRIHPPTALDLKVSEPVVYRNNSIYLYSNGTDLEDLEKNLTPHFEYRDKNEQTWNCTYFSAPFYQNTKWSVSFITPKNATLGSYDFRVRFNDTGILNFDKFFSNWCYLNDSLLVMNNIPKIENIRLSNESSLLGYSISIWINASDVEEFEENLSIDLEYQDHNEQSWNKSYLNIPSYLNNKWSCNFNIPFNAPFGYYDFRVRCNDSDGNFSAWFYLNDSLLVNNLNPNVIDLKLSHNSVYRTYSLSLFINGTDYETPEGMLNLYSQVKPKIDFEWINLSGYYLQDFWQIEISTEKNSTLGFWDFRVRFEDNENELSDWFYLNDSLEILNNLPLISDDLDDITIGFQPIILDLSPFESDIEDSNENLKWKIPLQEYSYIKSISLIDSYNDTLKIIPLENVTGTEDIELILMDKDNGTISKSDITVIIDNKMSESPPKVTLISPNDNSMINTLKPTLKWKLSYSGSESITYKIILDENPEPVEELKNELTNLEYTLETELEDGNTYYWTVVPQFGENNGVCLSGVWSFTVNISIPVPSITLIYPLDESILTTLRPTLYWSLNYSGTETVIYDIYLDTNLNLQEKIPNITHTSYTSTKNLKKDKTYYWKIVPKTKSIVGTGSEIWSFSIKIEEQPTFDLNLTLSTLTIEIKPGENKTIKAIVKNFATIKDEITLSLDFESIPGINTYIIEPKTIEIESKKSHEFNIVISLSENIDLEEIEIIITAKSNKAPTYSQTAEKSEILTVKILEFPEPDHSKEEKESESFNSMLGIVGVIIIIIIILMIIFLFMKKKKPQDITSGLIELDIQQQTKPTLEQLPLSPIPHPETQIQQPEQLQISEQIPELQTQQKTIEPQQTQVKQQIQYLEPQAAAETEKQVQQQLTPQKPPPQQPQNLYPPQYQPPTPPER